MAAVGPVRTEGVFRNNTDEGRGGRGRNGWYKRIGRINGGRGPRRWERDGGRGFHHYSRGALDPENPHPMPNRLPAWDGAFERRSESAGPKAGESWGEGRGSERGGSAREGGQEGDRRPAEERQQDGGWGRTAYQADGSPPR